MTKLVLDVKVVFFKEKNIAWGFGNIRRVDWVSKTAGDVFDLVSQHGILVFFYIKRVGVCLFKVLQRLK